MTYYHLSANVGSLGCRQLDSITPDTVPQVRRNLFNLLNQIKEAHGCYPSSVGLQESGSYTVPLAPIFGTPLADDSHAIFEHEGRNKARGVVTYAAEATTTTLPPLDNISERLFLYHVH